MWLALLPLLSQGSVIDPEVVRAEKIVQAKYDELNKRLMVGSTASVLEYFGQIAVAGFKHVGHRATLDYSGYADRLRQRTAESPQLISRHIAVQHVEIHNRKAITLVDWWWKSKVRVNDQIHMVATFARYQAVWIPSGDSYKIMRNEILWSSSQVDKNPRVVTVHQNPEPIWGGKKLPQALVQAPKPTPPTPPKKKP